MFDKYKYPLVGALTGLVLATSIIALGFFRTLFLIVFMVLGTVAAVYLEKYRIIQIIKNKLD